MFLFRKIKPGVANKTDCEKALKEIKLDPVIKYSEQAKRDGAIIRVQSGVSERMSSTPAKKAKLTQQSLTSSREINANDREYKNAGRYTTNKTKGFFSSFAEKKSRRKMDKNKKNLNTSTTTNMPEQIKYSNDTVELELDDFKYFEDLDISKSKTNGYYGNNSTEIRECREAKESQRNHKYSYRLNEYSRTHRCSNDGGQRFLKTTDFDSFASDGESMESVDSSSTGDSYSMVSSTDCSIGCLSNADTTTTVSSSEVDASSTSSFASTIISGSFASSELSRQSTNTRSISLQYDRLAPLSDAYIDDDIFFGDEGIVAMETDDMDGTSSILDDNLSTSSGLPDDVSDGINENCQSHVNRVDKCKEGHVNYGRVVSLAETGYASDDSLNKLTLEENIHGELELISETESSGLELNIETRADDNLGGKNNILLTATNQPRLNFPDIDVIQCQVGSNDEILIHNDSFTTSSEVAEKSQISRDVRDSVTEWVHDVNQVTVASDSAKKDEWENVRYRKRRDSGHRDGSIEQIKKKKQSIVSITTRPKSDYFIEYENIEKTHEHQTSKVVDDANNSRENLADDVIQRSSFYRGKFGTRESTCTVRRSAVYPTSSACDLDETCTEEDEYIKVEYKSKTFSRQPDLRVRIEDEVFRVHSALLREKSEYFRGVLSSVWAESFHIRQGQAIEFLSAPPTASAFRVLMDFLYFDRLNVTEETVEELVAAADFLQIVLPGSTVQKLLNIHNWDYYHQVCSKYKCQSIHRTIHQFVADHFRHISDSFTYLTKAKSTKASVHSKCQQNGVFTQPALTLVYMSRVHQEVECEHAMCCYDDNTKRWFEMETFPRVLPISTNRRWFTHAHNLFVSLQDTANMYPDGKGVMLQYNAKSAKWIGGIPKVPTSNSINGITATAGPGDKIYVLESPQPTVKFGKIKNEKDRMLLHVFERGAKLRPRWDKFAVQLNAKNADGPGQMYFYDVCNFNGIVYYLYTKAKCPRLYLGSIKEEQTPRGAIWKAREEIVVGGPYMHLGQSLRRLVTNGMHLYVVVTSSRCIIIKKLNMEEPALQEIARFDNENKLFKYVTYDRRRATAVAMVANKIYVYNFPRSKLICCYDVDSDKWSCVRMPPRLLSQPYDTLQMLSLNIPRDFPRVANPILT